LLRFDFIPSAEYAQEHNVRQKASIINIDNTFFIKALPLLVFKYYTKAKRICQLC